MNTVPERAQPSLWKPDQSDIAQLQRKLDSCEAENKCLNDLVRHIGESVIRHVKENE